MPLDTQPQPIRLADYRVPDFLIDSVDLDFDLRDGTTTVRAKLAIRRNPKSETRDAPLVLDGENLELKEICLDGDTLVANRYTTDAEHLTIAQLPNAFTLDIATGIKPEENTRLEGLYVSGGNYFTQCESEGFRHITYFLDRPDVMARYSVTIHADKTRHPVLLSNGNLVQSGEEGAGRHWAKWIDPFPKPTYLFALVAGDLAAHADSFKTRSGRQIALNIWVRPEDLDKCAHAMNSLIKSMRWDEEVYGLEYDLDLFNIVAVTDFNFGAMENKGLNIFNTKYVLARPDTATDTDYLNIEAVVAHEYFHNWTGDRVTCRDWFQLSLKEGLTVFRDQEFSSDMNSRAVKRIQDVRALRATQFPEDDGPTAHPVRPDSYFEINNFYTPTVYEKGAEVVRMIHTLIGARHFRAGIDLYFKRHDGQAVTCEDFVKAMEDASGTDLTQFRRWYSQAGTPRIEISDSYDPTNQTLALTLSQKTAPTPGQPVKEPMHIPVALGLIGPDGEDMPMRLESEPAGEASPGTRVLSLMESEQTFRFVGLPNRPVVSAFRAFSAPVIVDPASREQLIFRFAHDSDSFARWEAGQQLATALLLDMVAACKMGEKPRLDPRFVEAVGRILGDESLDRALVAEALSLPSEAYIADQMKVVDVDAIHAAREAARIEIAAAHKKDFQRLYAGLHDTGPYRITPEAMGARALKRLALQYLNAAGDGEGFKLALAQSRAGTNMTDVLAALGAIVDSERPEREVALADFYQRWQGEPLVIDKWFALQAMSSRKDTLANVQKLLTHPAFTYRTPNRVYALIYTFAGANSVRFHAASGEGYKFLADQMLTIDPQNPPVAARLMGPLRRWRRFDEGRQGLMRVQLQRIAETPGLSKDAQEIASKSLA